MSKNQDLKRFNEDEWDLVVQPHDNMAEKMAKVEDVEDESEIEDDLPMPAPQKRMSAKRKKQFIILGVSCGIFVLLFIVVLVLASSMLGNDKVYDGVTLGGQSVSGMSQEELQDYIYTRYVRPLEGAQVVLEIDAQRKTYDAASFLIAPDAAAMAEEMYRVGRKGGALSRLFGVYELKEEDRNFTVSYTVRPEILAEILTMTESQQYISKIEPSYVVEENQIIFTYGRDGLAITEEGLRDTFRDFEAGLEAAFASQETAPGGSYTVRVEPKKTEFRRILKVNVLNDLILESKDASFEKVSHKQMTIVPEFVAKQVDEGKLDEVLARVNAGTERTETQETLSLSDAPVIFTKAFYEEVLFRDCLGTAANYNSEDMGMDGTDFSVARGENIQLAVNQLNGMILLPGETFSFLEVMNDIPITSYQEAYEAYMGFDSQVVGGGISQVSSALYGAICTASITANDVHHYDYIPNFGSIGFDAYVSLTGDQDLTFTNSYDFPIKITASYTNRKVTVQIMGTLYRAADFAGLSQEQIPVVLQPESHNELSAKEVGRLNYTTVETQDPTLSEGSTVVTVSGITGYTVNLYVITTVEGSAQSRLIAQVTYKMRNEQIRVGTKVEGIDNDFTEE